MASRASVDDLLGLALEVGRLRMERDQALAQRDALAARVKELDQERAAPEEAAE